MIRFSRPLKFACLSAALILGACTHKQEAVNTAPPPAPPPPPMAAAAPVTSSILPGSAEDFRVNVGDTVHFALNQYNIEDSDKAVLAVRPPGWRAIRRCASPWKATATSAAPANTTWRWAHAAPMR